MASLAGELLGHALVAGVVVHVAHDDHFQARAFGHEGVFEASDLIAGSFAGLASGCS